jgi:hypothetical protein
MMQPAPRSRVDHYSVAQLCELLERAERMGFSLECGSELEKLTIAELAALVTSEGEA